MNEPSLEDLEDNPTRSQIAAAAVGLPLFSRSDYHRYVRDLGILGREALGLDPSNPRLVTELLGGPIDPSVFGEDHWIFQYNSIRNANVLLSALENAESVTEPEKEALMGYAKTIQAFDFLQVINTRDVNGSPIDVGRPFDDDPAPIVSKAAVFDHIVRLLDEGREHLLASGGAAFPFDISTIFPGFDTPASFLLFNRALKSRVDVYRGDFAGALRSLQESFLVECGAFDLGAYYRFSTASGDQVNRLFEVPATATIRAHPSLEDLAQHQAGGELDRRFLNKVVRTEPVTLVGHTSDLSFTIYEGPDSPMPIIRNEELILLRAEANIGLGDIGAAAGDINCIRVNRGGLAPRDDLTTVNALDELLYNKLFSLLFEGGHHWIDLRRYGKLGELPIDVPGDVLNDRFPIPRSEEQARGEG